MFKLIADHQAAPMSNLDSKQTSREGWRGRRLVEGGGGALILHTAKCLSGCHFKNEVRKKRKTTKKKNPSEKHYSNHLELLRLAGNFRSNCRAATEGVCSYLRVINILSYTPSASRHIQSGEMQILRVSSERQQYIC